MDPTQEPPRQNPVGFKDLSAAARTLWAKSGDGNGHSLLAHMLDVAAVAEAILERESSHSLDWAARTFALSSAQAVHLDRSNDRASRLRQGDSRLPVQVAGRTGCRRSRGARLQGSRPDGPPTRSGECRAAPPAFRIKGTRGRLDSGHHTSLGGASRLYAAFRRDQGCNAALRGSGVGRGKGRDPRRLSSNHGTRRGSRIGRHPAAGSRMAGRPQPRVFPAPANRRHSHHLSSDSARNCSPRSPPPARSQDSLPAASSSPAI
jgi:hypothetical protein